MDDNTKIKCTEILERIEEKDLISLADTITTRLVNVSDKQEAIRAILSYCPSAKQLLHRKKMKRNVLFSYLVENKIVPEINSEKSALVDMVLSFWNRDDQEAVSRIKTVQQQRNISTFQSIPNITQVELINPAHHTHERHMKQPIGQQLAESFIPWYFTLFNAICSTQKELTNQERNSQWNTDHFWGDCQFTFLYESQTQQYSEELNNSNAVNNFILNLGRKHQMILNPSDSAQGKIDEFGLAMIEASGTVHKGQNQPIGIFKQVFYLIRDPTLQNNWKIKSSKLYIKISNNDNCLSDYRSIQLT